MQMPWTWIVFICLSGIVSSEQNLDSRHDVDALMEVSAEISELEIAPVPSPRIDAGATVSGAHAVEESEDEHLQANAEKVIKQEKTGSGNLEASRRRRSAWGKRKHAATVESIAYRIAGLGRPISGWRKRGKGGEGSNALMAALRELHAEKRRLMDLRKAREEEEDDDDDEDDDDEDDDDDDEEEEEEEEEVIVCNLSCLIYLLICPVN
ncbi:putative DNA helicase INO80 [Oreochromis niloticus]|uniref:putative DNA helicase INO80 n=1 Tax=Oreochromis niloticus TaxID=8128 RepID=UPI000DF480B4|nr:putative DNA helicase INO80 [Oreochromis niloticus]